MVVITPTASYSGSNVLQSRARPADAGPGPTPPGFTGSPSRTKRRLGHSGDAPSRVLFDQPAAELVSVFIDGGEERPIFTRGPSLERDRPSEFCNDPLYA